MVAAGQLFGQDLGLVVGVARQHHRGRLVQVHLGAVAEHNEGAQVDEPPDLSLGRRLQHGLQALNVDPYHLLGLGPVRDVGRAVEDGGDALYGAPAVGLLGDVADHELEAELL